MTSTPTSTKAAPRSRTSGCTCRQTAGTPNLALNKTATADSSCAANEGPAKAVNGTVNGGNSDKWCSVGSSKWLRVDLGSSQSVGKIVLKHSGSRWRAGDLEHARLRRAGEHERHDVDQRGPATGNTANITTHTFTPQSVRYIRVNVITPTSNSDTGGPHLRTGGLRLVAAPGAGPLRTGPSSFTGSHVHHTRRSAYKVHYRLRALPAEPLPSPGTEPSTGAPAAACPWPVRRARLRRAPAGARPRRRRVAAVLAAGLRYDGFRDLRLRPRPPSRAPGPKHRSEPCFERGARNGWSAAQALSDR